jgi:hypothetical protein
MFGHQRLQNGFNLETYMDELHPAPDTFQDMRRAQKALSLRQIGSLWSWAARIAQYLSFRAVR